MTAPDPARPNVVTPIRRHSATGSPVMATRWETGTVIGHQVGWLNRWVEALGGVSVTTYEGPDDDRRLVIHVTVPGGRITWHPGQWLVHDLAGGFAVWDDDAFEREHVTDLMPVTSQGVDDD